MQLLTKVLRRTGYKGGIANDAALPVDGATVMGILVVSGSLLTGVALQQSTLTTCIDLFREMESKATLPSRLCFLPGNNSVFCLDVDDNKILLSALKECMKRVEIPWNRWGFQKSHLLFVLCYDCNVYYRHTTRKHPSK